jgi:nucleosome binding factor SPN SPT16 subunit
MAITASEVFILGSKKKTEFLSGLARVKDEAGTLPITLLTLQKKEDPTGYYDQLCAALKASNAGAKVGMFTGKTEAYTGAFIEGFLTKVDAAGLARVNVAAGIGILLSGKDEEEVQTMKFAAKLSSDVVGRVFKVQMLDIIDEETKKTHSEIADEVEKFISETDNEKYEKHAKKLKLEPDQVESCFTPIIQSGGNYSLKVSAQSDDSPLVQGVIIAAAGARYKSYCSNVARTFIVGEPAKSQEKNYNFLLQVQEEALKVMKVGKPVSGVHSRVKAFIQEKRPDLSKLLAKNSGFCMGIDFRESALQLNEANDQKFAPRSVWNLAIGFDGIENEEAKSAAEKNYALFIADTVLVTASEAEVLTPTKKKYGAMFLVLQELIVAFALGIPPLPLGFCLKRGCISGDFAACSF